MSPATSLPAPWTLPGPARPSRVQGNHENVCAHLSSGRRVRSAESRPRPRRRARRQRVDSGWPLRLRGPPPGPGRWGSHRHCLPMGIPHPRPPSVVRTVLHLAARYRPDHVTRYPGEGEVLSKPASPAPCGLRPRAASLPTWGPRRMGRSHCSLPSPTPPQASGTASSSQRRRFVFPRGRVRPSGQRLSVPWTSLRSILLLRPRLACLLTGRRVWGG